jgi:N utilization substance protein A
MKNEFELAFNEIADTLKLSKDVIIEALEAALVSAYRRNVGVSSAQAVQVSIDEMSGQATILAEKEVVEDVQDSRTEVDLKTAHVSNPDAEMGDMVMVESTPRNFGRIAAQTAKQVLLQRMREAERSAQYEEYRERIGDLVTGTVQSVSDSAVTVGLGRSEAILPRSQQVPGERYRTHDKVRAYVMEVRETTRGPQIILSRAHRSMLRRLLEYEVPEIYSGTVEIKNIAREPGARSKVAVFATQEGVDPVGACVGMRGVRIQSIVRELNDEKIDVIEWNPNQEQFIAKALSPARVSSVFLDDNLDQGRTAIVIVPDDQLSLAIGREGQNARLAAKLTGWRIDIKSVTEAATDALELTQQPELAQLVVENAEMIEQIERIMAKKASNRPVMPEDYQLLGQFINTVESYRLNLLQTEREEIEAQRAAVREHIPPNAYLYPLDETSLPLRIYNILAEAGFETFGDVMEQVVYDEQHLLDLPGFGPKALETVKEIIESEEIPEPEPEPVEVEEVEEAPEAEAEVVAEEEVAAEPVAEAEVEAGADAEVEVPSEVVLEAAAVEVEPVVEETAPVVEPEIAPIERRPEPVVPARRYEDELKDDPFMDEEGEEKTAKDRAKRRRRQLVFDEDLGEVVAKRRRKASRSRSNWEDFDDLDEIDELELDDVD